MANPVLSNDYTEYWAIEAYNLDGTVYRDDPKSSGREIHTNTDTHSAVILAKHSAEVHLKAGRRVNCWEL
jgi:hypothetical protein